jgi:hypothetical protein
MQVDKYMIHEVMHMTSFLANSVDLEICDHPAIMENPNWRELADDAMKALTALYVDISNYSKGDV